MQTDHSNSADSTIKQLQLDGGTLQPCGVTDERTLKNTLFSALYPRSTSCHRGRFKNCIATRPGALVGADHSGAGRFKGNSSTCHC
jgi:hypothetical protein